MSDACTDCMQLNHSWMWLIVQLGSCNSRPQSGDTLRAWGTSYHVITLRPYTALEQLRHSPRALAAHRQVFLSISHWAVSLYALAFSCSSVVNFSKSLLAELLCAPSGVDRGLCAPRGVDHVLAKVMQKMVILWQKKWKGIISEET